MTTVKAINPKPARTFTRAELEQTLDAWLEANRRAEAAGDWIAHLGPFYTDDAVYRWNIGPTRSSRHVVGARSRTWPSAIR
jgi:hypothetical protein